MLIQVKLTTGVTGVTVLTLARSRSGGEHALALKVNNVSVKFNVYFRVFRVWVIISHFN